MYPCTKYNGRVLCELDIFRKHFRVQYDTTFHLLAICQHISCMSGEILWYDIIYLMRAVYIHRIFENKQQYKDGQSA